MRKVTIYWFSLLLILLWMTSCKSSKPTVIKEVSTTTITETIHDTVFKIEKDSSMIRAYIDCINGKPVFKEIVYQKAGKDLSIPSATLKDNILEVTCEKRAQELFAQWKSKHILEEVYVEVPVEVVLPLTWWQSTQIYAGRILLLLLLLALVVWLIRKEFNAFGLKN